MSDLIKALAEAQAFDEKNLEYLKNLGIALRAEWAAKNKNYAFIGPGVSELAAEYIEARKPLDAALRECVRALEEIESRSRIDEAEGPELRAQNAANYCVALSALAALTRALGESE